MLELVDKKMHIVIKRDGREEPFSEEKLRKIINWAADKKEVYTDVILNNMSIKIKDRIKITDLYDDLIRTVSNMISPLYPIYDTIAEKLYIMKIYKETCGLKKSGEYPHLQTFLNKGIKCKIYDRKIINHFSKEDIDYLNSCLVPDRDFLYPFKGAVLMFDKYCKRYKRKQFELPQITYMVAAMYSFYDDYLKEGSKNAIKKSRKLRLELIKTNYNLLSLHYITYATPRLSNSMKLKPQLASCILNTPDDDTWSLNQTDSNMAVYSKFSGGIAYDASYIRASGSLIQSNSGVSDGPAPFIKRTEQTISSFNQSGLRKGSCVITFPWWHLDVLDLIMLKDAGGTEETRARKLVYAMRISNILRKRVLKDEEITLFDPKETPLLNETFGKEFDKNYLMYEQKAGIRKRKIKAKELIFKYLKVRTETGNIYATFIDNINEQNMRNVFVGASNLCVSGDTKILTRQGNLPIKELDGQDIECWDGEQWSLTHIAKTNDFAEVMEVQLSDGETLIVTPYHEWDIVKNKSNIKKKTIELCLGDSLAKYSNNFICKHGEKDLPMAYINGFFTADGTLDKNKKIKIIFLYDKKKKLLKYFNNYKWKSETKQKISLYYDYDYDFLKDKYFIPSIEYNIQSRLNWLAGYLDGDGTVVISKKNSKSIQITSINKQFLLDLKSFLLELGVVCSIKNREFERQQLMPDGKGGKKLYPCKPAYRINIGANSVKKLLELGLITKRLDLNLKDYNNISNQENKLHYTKIVLVKKCDFVIPTYCGNNPRNHKLVFNGNITFQCQEITVPSSPSKLLSEKIYKSENNSYEIHRVLNSGEIGICNLSSINLVSWVKLSNKEKFELMYSLLRGCDNIIDTQFYPAREGEISNKRNRPIGIGVTNYANLLASNKLKYTDEATKQFTFDVFEDLYYYVYLVSNKLAQERGAYETFKHDKWAQGLTPVHVSKFNYKKFGLVFKNKKRWDELGKNIKKFGVRFSLHSAIAPTACMTKDTEITELDNVLSLGDFLTKWGIDVNFIEEDGVPKWVYFEENNKPIINTRFGKKELNRAWYNGKQKVRIIEFENGSKIKVTLNHPLLVKDRGWIKAEDLKEDDDIVEIGDGYLEFKGNDYDN